MNRDDALRRLFLLLVLVTGCFVVSSLLSSAYLWAILGHMPTGMNEAARQLTLHQLRVFIGINQFFSFLLPGIIAIYFFKFSRGDYLQNVRPLSVGLFVLIYLFSLPLFQYLFYINMNFEVPQWWPFQVEALPPFLINLIKDTSLSGLLFNLLVIAVLPAIGEELIFRVLGIKICRDIFRSGHWAVIVTAFVFSLIHFDFQGLLPRFLLGIVLGYSFLFSQNFLVPFLIHFIHNGTQLIIAYFSPTSIENYNQNIEPPHMAYILLSVILLVSGFWFASKRKTIE